MKDRFLFLTAVTFVFCGSAHGQSFAGEYADKNYQNGNAVFQMSIEGSGNDTQVWFSAGKKNGQGAAPEGEGRGKFTGKGVFEFKFEDSFHNSGTGTITRSGDSIIVSLKATKVVTPECVRFYGDNIRLKRVK